VIEYPGRHEPRPTSPEAAAEVLLEFRAWSLLRDGPAGSTTLLRDIDLVLRRGEWLGILGANGSGKTSLLRYLAGEDSPLGARSAMVFQDPDEGIVAGSVGEELTLGQPRTAKAAAQRWLTRTLAAYNLAGYELLPPQLLSAGQKQRLAVAVALAGRPEVLFCDEPTSLQDREGADWLLHRLRSWWRETGGTVLYTTQRREEALLADRLLLLSEGRLVAEGLPPSVMAHPEAVRLLGEPTAASDLPKPRLEARSDQGALVARWEGIGCRYPLTGTLFRGVDLAIPAGSRIGLTGPNGCGKSTLLAMAVGWRAPDVGRCVLLDRPLCPDGKPDLDHGAALLAPQFPEYLFTRSRVDAEIGLDPALARWGTDRLLQSVALPADHAGRNPHELSSGQKRRLALALVIRSGRPLLLLDEPTAGLDLPGRRQVLGLLSEVPEQTAVVVASHDVSFLKAWGGQINVLTADGLLPLATDGVESKNSAS